MSIFVDPEVHQDELRQILYNGNLVVLNAPKSSPGLR